MFFEKLKNNESGILLYGQTPPKQNHQNLENLLELRKKRLNLLDVDGIVIYDLQDEGDRNDEKRTFEFVKTIDPYEYYKSLELKFPGIIYKSVGKYSQDEFIKSLKFDKNIANVFVGASSKDQKIKLSLKKAYEIKKEFAKDIPLGGICIPERHEAKHNEHLKVANKTLNGCEFFITQAVYNAINAKNFIDDYAKLNIKKVPIIFTFTPCGSLKTLEFMKWLGISIPPFLENRLKNSIDILQSSVSLSFEMFEFIYRYAKNKGVIVGANVESISTRKVEIEASIKLLQDIKRSIDRKV